MVCLGLSKNNYAELFKNFYTSSIFSVIQKKLSIELK